MKKFYFFLVATLLVSVVAVTKAQDVTPPVVVVSDAECIKNAINTRESNIIDSLKQRNDKLYEAMQVRTSAINVAVDLEKPKLIKKATIDARKAFTKSRSSINTEYKKKISDAWSKFLSEKKTCKLNKMYNFDNAKIVDQSL